MNLDIKVIGIILLVAAFFAYQGGYFPRPQPGPGPNPPSPVVPVPDGDIIVPADTNIPAPSPQALGYFEGTLDGVKSAGQSVPKKEKILLGNFYKDFAAIVMSEPGAVTTSDQARNALIQAGQIKFRNLGISSRYPAFAQAIDTALSKGLQMQQGPIDEAKRQRMKDVFNALAYTLYNA